MNMFSEADVARFERQWARAVAAPNATVPDVEVQTAWRAATAFTAIAVRRGAASDSAAVPDDQDD